MNKIDLDGQTAVVTGGAQGLGFAIARRIVASGARVSPVGHGCRRTGQGGGELGAAAKAVVVNIADSEAVVAAAAKSEADSGPISILVNSAGIAGPNHPLEAYPLDDWQRVIDINLNGAFYVNRAVVPGMKARGYGRIVNIASIAGKEGNPNASAYSASKAAVIGMTKSLGKELAGLDIAVNAITPAAARTRIFDQMKQEHIDYMLSKIPRARVSSRSTRQPIWLPGSSPRKTALRRRPCSICPAAAPLTRSGKISIKFLRYRKACSEKTVITRSQTSSEVSTGPPCDVMQTLLCRM